MFVSVMCEGAGVIISGVCVNQSESVFEVCGSFSSVCCNYRHRKSSLRVHWFDADAGVSVTARPTPGSAAVFFHL